MFRGVIRVLRMAGKDRNAILLSFFVTILEKITTFAPFLMIFYGVDSYLKGSLDTSVVRNVAIVMVVSVVLMAISRRIIDELLPVRGINIFARKKVAFLSHLSRLPMGYFTEGNLGNISSILTTDMAFAEEAVITYIGEIVTAYFSLILNALFISIFNVYLGLTYIGVLIFGYFAFRFLDHVNKVHGEIRQKQFGHLSGKVVEYVRGMATIKAFNVLDKTGSDIEREFETTKDKALAFEKSYLLPRFAVDGSYTVGAAILLFVTLFLHNQGMLEARYAIGLLIFGTASFLPLAILASGVTRMRLFGASLDKFDRVMAEKELIDGGNRTAKISNHDIAFENVSFGYTQKNVIDNISFQLKEKTLTALVGQSGSGKTTITSLISRFWDIEEGSITIGGIDIKDIPLETLMNHISIVFQNVYLFKDTILNNIAFGEENPTKESVIEAAKKARCHDFIMKLPDGYNTMIGEGGATLSGGEKQRIAIARAILKDAPIVLLDEATSSVDPENEKFIQDAISELVKNKTLIVIAHKLSSVVNADKILFIENGKLVEEGTHLELIAKKGKYNELYSYYV